MKNQKTHNLKGCRCPKGVDIRFCLGNAPVKPKTIEDIVYSAFYDNSRLKVIRYCNEDKWPIKEVSKQIKQLIADEVIGEDEKDQEVTVMKMELTETYLEASTAALCYHARKKLREQQRKKLESL